MNRETDQFCPHPKSLSRRRGTLNLAPFSQRRRVGDEGNRELHNSNRIAMLVANLIPIKLATKVAKDTDENRAIASPEMLACPQILLHSCSTAWWRCLRVLGVRLDRRNRHSGQL